ncbi:MAG: ABC transporter ATP-binding protein/permease, partial [Lachnospiraceae bacterium]|nr:ABC transporter ATP-binding protein/permease [Lachnospiraceae bacterium]
MAFSTGLSGILRVLGEAAVNSEALKITFEFLDIPNEMYQGSLTVEKRSDRKYEVEFRNVSFKYPHTENYVLRNISLKFRVGERLAVVGENGSGKTTFIKLLCRLYDPTEGVILLNGIDIRKYNYREYLSVFSVVFQDFQLLSVSLGENVAAGSRDGKGTLSFGGRRLRHSGKEGGYDRDRVLDCVRMAGLSRWLDAQPEGLDTILYRDLDEKGVKISGGEAQKAAIARSLYHNAPFVILDEPTAALDPEAEYEIYTKFNEIVGGRTDVYISHRPVSYSHLRAHETSQAR